MSVTTILNVTLYPGENFVEHDWTDAQTVRAHVALPLPGPPTPGCDFAMGVTLTQAIEKDGKRGLTLKYESPLDPPEPLTGGTVVVFEG